MSSKDISWQVTEGILNAVLILAAGVLIAMLGYKYAAFIFAALLIVGGFAGFLYGFRKLILRFDHAFPGWGKVLFIGMVILVSVLGVLKH